MLITIALVSHNNRKDLELLLPSVQTALKGISSEILLVDNCSHDSTASLVEDAYSEVSIISESSILSEINITVNKKRLGYAANQNQNIAKARGKFIALMNPDMIVPENLFHTLIQFMDQHKDAGIATCRICNEDGSCQYLNKREPALFDLLIRRFLPFRLHGLFKKRLDAYEMRDIGYERVVDVPFVSGSFIFARTSLIKEIGGFDERFFMYFEDVDICRRARKKARALYCPDAQIIHRWERAAHKSFKWTVVFALSGLKYYHKWGFKFF